MQKIVTDAIRPAGGHDPHGVAEAEAALAAAYRFLEERLRPAALGAGRRLQPRRLRRGAGALLRRHGAAARRGASRGSRPISTGSCRRRPSPGCCSRRAPYFPMFPLDPKPKLPACRRTARWTTNNARSHPLCSAHRNRGQALLHLIVTVFDTNIFLRNTPRDTGTRGHVRPRPPPGTMPANLCTSTRTGPRHTRAAYFRRCSVSRGMISTKLHGRCRASSCAARIPSQASRQAPGDPGSAKR